MCCCLDNDDRFTVIHLSVCEEDLDNVLNSWRTDLYESN